MRMLRALWILAALSLVAVPVMAQVFGDVVITEVMYDDAGGTEIDFIEIHNTTGATIDISGWVVIDGANYPASGGEGAFQVPASTSIAAGAYLVLVKDAGSGLTGAIQCTQYFGSFTLGNTGDNIALYTAQTGGTLIDGSLTVQYPDEGVNGTSIEKCDPNATWTNDPAAWIPSTTAFAGSARYLFCTPGAPNTPCGGGDVTPPALTSVTVISSTQLDVLFSEAVNQTVAETEANYSVNNGVGAPTLATRDGGNTSLVHLTFAAMAPNSYILTVATIEDLAGNDATNLTGNFVINAPAGNTVVITEVMYDDTAANANPDVEWVEIYNTTGATINIGGWILLDSPTYPISTEGAWYIPAGTMITSHQYLVLCEVAIPEFAGEIVCGDSGSGVGLSNSGDNLALYTALTGGTLIHGSLTTLFPDLAFTNGGNSIEVCLADVGSDWDLVNWYESAAVFGAGDGRYQHCTPGAAPSPCSADVTPPVLVSATLSAPNQVDALFDESLDEVSAETITNYSVDNSVGNPTTAVLQGDARTVRLTFSASFTPATYTLTVNNVADLALNLVAANSTAQFVVEASEFDIVFTEVMPNPNFAGNDDEFGEWLEIYNRGNSAVNMSGWRIADAQGSDTLEGTVTIPAHGYFVFCSNGDSATNGGVPENYDYQFATSGWGLALSNGGETISLRDASNTIVASINYSGFPYAAGASAQLTDVNLDPSNAANWCQALSGWVGANNNDHGTPGAATICALPDVADTVTICQIRQQTECGVSVWDDSLLVTYGVVTHNDSCRGNMYVEANGCAVLVFGAAARTIMIGAGRLALPGDSVKIVGTLDRFAGLTEFSQFALEAVEVTFISAGHVVPAATVVTAGTISQNAAACGPESYESRHVTVNNMTFVETGVFVADSNFRLVNGTDTIQFRLHACDTSLIGDPIPASPVNVTGVVAQYDTTSDACYCHNYQLLTSRLTPLTDALCGIPLQLTTLRLADLDSVQLRWTVPQGNNCGCYNVWYSTASEPVFPTDYILATPTPITATQYNHAIAGINRRIYVVTGIPCP